MSVALASHPLAAGHPPAWASEWGEDEHGVFVAFTVDDETQRLRWISPGRFRMGSPESEAGRRESEGPRHEVTLSRGFWLGETPCTQALYEAVAGDNPSRFVSPDRPVEQVSWEDCQAFLEKLNGRLAGLDARLPSEAEWEYACRAGSQTGTYAGELEILGANHAPLLDDIAWYGGNSGVGFELEDGADTSWFPDKQFSHDKGGTHLVGQKEPNAWGLFDMLGNVWEWCEDAFASYGTEAQRDPVCHKGSLRVSRGGSWDGRARHVRAAARLAHSPGFRLDDLGFRLARGQEE